MQSSVAVNGDLNKGNHSCEYSVTESMRNHPHRDHVNTEWLFQEVDIWQGFPFVTSINTVLHSTPCLLHTSCGSQQERMVFSPPAWRSLPQTPMGIHTHLSFTQGREPTTWTASSCSSFHLSHGRGMRVEEMQWRNLLNSEEKKNWGLLADMIEIRIWERKNHEEPWQINEIWWWHENVLHDHWKIWIHRHQA